MYKTASTEPLDIIRANECEGSPGLAASRFQALWNEIERLRAALVPFIAAADDSYGYADSARIGADPCIQLGNLCAGDLRRARDMSRPLQER